jgi:hypothetical protein
MLRLNKNKEFINPYSINDKVEFLDYRGIWVKGVIIDFKITNYIYKAVIKCKNINCRNHYVCVCSIYLRKLL